MDPWDWWANNPLTGFWDFSSIQVASSFFQFRNSWCVSYFLNEWFSSSPISTWINIWGKGSLPFMLQENYDVSLVIGKIGNTPRGIFLKYPLKNLNVPRPILKFAIVQPGDLLVSYHCDNSQWTFKFFSVFQSLLPLWNVPLLVTHLFLLLLSKSSQTFFGYQSMD